MITGAASASACGASSADQRNDHQRDDVDDLDRGLTGGGVLYGSRPCRSPPPWRVGPLPPKCHPRCIFGCPTPPPVVIEIATKRPVMIVLPDAAQRLRTARRRRNMKLTPTTIERTGKKARSFLIAWSACRRHTVLLGGAFHDAFILNCLRPDDHGACGLARRFIAIAPNRYGTGR